ncbi:protein translocase subunit yajC [Polaribacter sp. Hel1_33_78]|jgi:preprotein translocase subunit YajC|uniref:preprotein translocase subunit YajC n=1 Tax=unclassified Polaribacter TaxID=196858 RepID=UPI00052C4843|nr:MULTISPECIES: preprotein translocase subunit YajC [unclassified Polaribacter]KGL60663.1 preprotein translocase subunit YajC [Polaribacter sp. Hel1_33_49]MBT3741773.1 preprotein translocase subunit YajC [Polaribacter sp.]MBT4414451.1 preprotein translocase subunit YajC [Polaribacter sp.]MBT7815974.1 preprotein translocase subunit YajC [Polaribacter sp.]MDG1194828.1 preprotein translocase subunit YajC [Polaribacter sp.]
MISIIVLQFDAGSLSSMLPFIAMIGVLYFFMIRPQMNRQKKEKSFQAEIKKGTKIVTSSGIHGKIVELNAGDNTVTIETGAGKIKFERSAISMELSQKYVAPAVKK